MLQARMNSMDAVLNYLEQKLQGVFVSKTPSSVLVVWWPTQQTEASVKYGSFITRGMNQGPHRLEDKVLHAFQSSLVKYSYDRKDDNFCLCIGEQNLQGTWNDEKMMQQAASLLNIEYKPGGTSKPPNNYQQVNDIFHIWSRAAFGGIQKTDVDLVLFDDDSQHVKAIVEVKRSAKIKVGEWTPFRNDPYGGLIGIAQSKKVPFLTVHHELAGSSQGAIQNMQVDIFCWYPDKPFKFDEFASAENRKIWTIGQLSEYLKNL